VVGPLPVDGVSRSDLLTEVRVGTAYRTYCDVQLRPTVLA